MRETFEFMRNVADRWGKKVMICELALSEDGTDLEYVPTFLDNVFSYADLVDGVFVLDFVDFPLSQYFIKDAKANLFGLGLAEKISEKFLEFQGSDNPSPGAKEG